MVVESVDVGPWKQSANCHKTFYVRVRASTGIQGQPFVVRRPNCFRDFGTLQNVLGKSSHKSVLKYIPCLLAERTEDTPQVINAHSLLGPWRRNELFVQLLDGLQENYLLLRLCLRPTASDHPEA